MTTGYKFIAAFVICFATAGCSFLGDIPPQFRIDQGIHPKYQDDDVRFRTTYYFRVWDSCEGEAEGAVAQSPTPSQPFTDKPFGPYKLRNDSLYRFRMIGKSNAHFSTVRFESGTLRAEQIDMFGATVRPDKDSGAFKLISARQGRDEALLDAKIQEISKLLRIRDGELSKVSGGQAKLDNVILDKVQGLNDSFQTRHYSLVLTALHYMNAAEQAKAEVDKLAQEVITTYTPTPLIANSTDDKNRLDPDSVKLEVATRLKLIKDRSGKVAENVSNTVNTLKNFVEGLKKDKGNETALKTAQSRLDHAQSYQKKTQDIVTLISELENSSTLKSLPHGNAKQPEPQDPCPNGQQARRGFKILGPEGFRTFDQDERLLMAFSYDAKPLISLLQELSSRKLSLRDDIGPLRELAKERISLRDALNELGKAKVELEQSDPSRSELSTEGIVKRIEERLGGLRAPQIPELDLSTASRTH